MLGVYDISQDLKGTYTTLISREDAQRIRNSLRAELQSLEEGGILALDFDVVAEMSRSFLEEVLVPLLRELGEHRLGERHIIGVNFRSDSYLGGDPNEVFSRAGLCFLAFDPTARPQWLGVTDDEQQRILELLWKEQRASVTDTVKRLSIDPLRAQASLDELLSVGAIRASTEGMRRAIYERLLPEAEYEEIKSRNVAQGLARRIEEKRALRLDGHFKIPTGNHSRQFLSFTLLADDARFVSRMAVALARRLQGGNPDVVIGATLTGIAVTQKMAEYLDCRAIYVGVTGRASLYPGFELVPRERAIIVSDVIGTGTLIREMLGLVVEEGARCVGVASPVDASGGKAVFDSIRPVSLIHYDFDIYSPYECPMCEEGIPLETPVWT